MFKSSMSVEKPEAKRVTFPPFEKGNGKGKKIISGISGESHIGQDAYLSTCLFLLIWWSQLSCKRDYHPHRWGS